MLKIIAIIGARPQFIKHFPFEKAANGKLNLITLHTGQHYDSNMSEVFFHQLKMTEPKYILSLGGGSHGKQTGKMLIEIERIVEIEKPDGIVVYGDTNSTLAGALVASKLKIPLFHIEAGLRSYNKEMPEEINRILTDHVSDLLFVPSAVAEQNLFKEGIKKGVVIVGDIMKDLINDIIKNDFIGKKKSNVENYYYVTIHRPYNTDDENRLSYILKSLNSLSSKIIISMHPRTRHLANKYNIELENYENVEVIEPQSYFDNLNYLFYSNGLITDSGGMQKEAYWLKKRCVTIRKETEWVETVERKGNTLLFDDLSSLANELKDPIENWDANLYGNGNCANEIVSKILSF